MALITPGPLITKISGRVGSLIFEAGGNGPIIKTRGFKVKKKTKYELLARNRLQRAATTWAALSANHRTGWSRTAKLFSSTNRLGIRRPLSGWQLFCRVVIEQWPSDANYEVPEAFIGAAPPPSIVSVSMGQSADWTVTVDAPVAAGSQSIYIHIARPRKMIPLRAYYRYFKVLGADLGSQVFRFRNYSIHDPRLDDAIVGEILHLKVRQSIATPTGYYLMSAPATIHGTVT